MFCVLAWLLVSSGCSAAIPRIIHQIWLGSELPGQFVPLQETVKRYHPNWEYRLWTDDLVRTLTLENQDLFDQATNWGEKSDILRYELLYRYGGVYLDIDIACVKPLDPLHELYDFYIGYQPEDTGHVQLGTGVIGARAGHWLVKELIVNLRTVCHYPRIVQRTGPQYVTALFTWCMANMPHATRDVALPACYFYPLGYTQKWQEFTLPAQSYTVHYWAGSWR